MDNRHGAANPRVRSTQTLEERMIREERSLAEMILQRSQVLADIAKRRKQEHRPGADPRLEKALWQTWEQVLTAKGLPQQRIWRELVAQLNSLAYCHSEESSAGSQQRIRPLYFRPAIQPVELSGAADIAAGQTLVFWAAASNAQVTLQDPLLNDYLVELIKTLNQAGANLSWNDQSVTHDQRADRFLFAPDQGQKTIHAGHHQNTLALLTALALGRPGITKISGSSTLNMLDLKSWQNVCTQLGARLHRINPHAPGLPIRLESTGRPERAAIDAATPSVLVAALLASAPFYPQGLHLSWPTSYALGHDGQQILGQLQDAGIPVHRSAEGVHVPAGRPNLDAHAALGLDPQLNALILAWARFSNQRITVQGQWSGTSQAAEAFAGLLRSCGLDLKLREKAIAASPQAWPDSPVFDVRGFAPGVPLAVVLALSAAQGGTVLSEEPLAESAVIEDLLRFTGSSLESGGDRHLFRRQARPPDRDVFLEATDALWGMALSLLAYAHPGMMLVNPGIMTGLWPKYWHIYRTILSAPPRFKPEASLTESDDANPQRQRRRVRI